MSFTELIPILAVIATFFARRNVSGKKLAVIAVHESNKSYIAIVPFDRKDDRPDKREHFTSTPDPVFGLAYDSRSSQLYYSDGANIFRKNLWETDSERSEVIIESDARKGKPMSLTFDCITGNIFYASGALNQIGVCNHNGNFCAQVISKGVDGNGLALNVKLGRMFWTSFRSDGGAIIRSANMDGSDMRFEVWGSDIYRPRKLQLDIGSETHLYFTDGETGNKRIKIWVTDVTRLNSQRIVKRIDLCNGTANTALAEGILKCPGYLSFEPKQIEGLAVMGDRFFYIHFPYEYIRSCDKFDGTDCHVDRRYWVSLLHQYSDVAMFDDSTHKQVTRQNDCTGGRGCSHVCVLTLHSYRCVCPMGFKLDPVLGKLFVKVETNVSIHWIRPGHGYTRNPGIWVGIGFGNGFGHGFRG